MDGSKAITKFKKENFESDLVNNFQKFIILIFLGKVAEVGKFLSSLGLLCSLLGSDCQLCQNVEKTSFLV